MILNTEPDGLAEMHAAVERQFSCDATWLMTVLVKRPPLTDNVIRSGEVAVFMLHGHPFAIECYAWQYVTLETEIKIAIMLQAGIVDSPESAVMVAIVNEIRRRRGG